MTPIEIVTCILLILAIGYVALYLYLENRFEKKQKKFKNRINKID
tara:strand:- start:574 stop:708 length:135 start_codon:yes stop_codon:yes gene_type:complete